MRERLDRHGGHIQTLLEGMKEICSRQYDFNSCKDDHSSTKD